MVWEGKHKPIQFSVGVRASSDSALGLLEASQQFGNARRGQVPNSREREIERPLRTYVLTDLNFTVHTFFPRRV